MFYVHRTHASGTRGIVPCGGCRSSCRAWSKRSKKVVVVGHDDIKLFMSTKQHTPNSRQGHLKVGLPGRHAWVGLDEL